MATRCCLKKSLPHTDSISKCINHFFQIIIVSIAKSKPSAELEIISQHSLIDPQLAHLLLSLGLHTELDYSCNILASLMLLDYYTFYVFSPILQNSVFPESSLKFALVWASRFPECEKQHPILLIWKVFIRSIIIYSLCLKMMFKSEGDTSDIRQLNEHEMDWILPETSQIQWVQVMNSVRDCVWLCRSWKFGLMVVLWPDSNMRREERAVRSVKAFANLHYYPYWISWQSGESRSR